MYLCFVCKAEYTTTKNLYSHIKLRHLCNEYCCGQPNCHRKYSTIKSLTRHLDSQHTQTPYQSVDSICDTVDDQTIFFNRANVEITDIDNNIDSITNNDSFDDNSKQCIRS